MRISDNSNYSNLDKYLFGANSPNQTSGANESVSNQDSSLSAAQSQSDSVQISLQAQQIANLSQMVANSSDTNPAQISQIQNQISAGNYTVDPNQVAKKLVSETILNQIL